jgi:hypothetical protein
MNLAKELEKLREQLASLQQRRKVCLFLNIERDWTMQQIEAAANDLVERAITAGRLDPTQHEPMVCRFWTEAEDQASTDKGLWQPQWERPEPVSRLPAMEAFEPLPEPKPEKPTKIYYPDGSVPY